MKRLNCDFVLEHLLDCAARKCAEAGENPRRELCNSVAVLLLVYITLAVDTPFLLKTKKRFQAELQEPKAMLQ